MYAVNLPRTVQGQIDYRLHVETATLHFEGRPYNSPLVGMEVNGGMVSFTPSVRRAWPDRTHSAAANSDQIITFRAGNQDRLRELTPEMQSRQRASLELSEQERLTLALGAIGTWELATELSSRPVGAYKHWLGVLRNRFGVPARHGLTSVVGAAFRQGYITVERPAQIHKPLAQQERAVLAHLSQGKTAGQISTELAILPGTVTSTSQRIRFKLGVYSTATAVFVGSMNGQLEHPPQARRT